MTYTEQRANLEATLDHPRGLGGSLYQYMYMYVATVDRPPAKVDGETVTLYPSTGLPVDG